MGGRRRIALYISMATVFAACSSAGAGTTSAPVATTQAVNTPVDEFVQSLKPWDELSPPAEQLGAAAVGEPTQEQVAADDGQAYKCVTQKYSLTENPKEVVLADPNAGQIWPGAILDGAGYAQGSIRPVAVSGDNRAPLGLSVLGGGVLGIRGGISQVVEQPVGSTVREGINQLIANALDSEVVPGAGFSSFESVESFSAEQAVLDLGLSAKFLGNKVKAELNYQHDASKHTYTAYFIQRLYTIAADPPQTPSDFFASSVTPEELTAIGIGPDNPPLYIGSVSYGRILMYSITSSASRTQIEGAIDYSYRGPATSVKTEVEASYDKLLEGAEIHVLAVGGSNAGVQDLIKSADLASYFDQDLQLNQVEPIAFTVNRLSDNQVADVVDTTDYEKTTCEVVAAALPKPDYWFTMDGTLDDAADGAKLAGIDNNFIAGRFGQALQFDGVYESANTYDGGAHDVLVPTDAGFSISAWINPRSAGKLGTIISQVGSNLDAGEFAIRVDPSRGNLFFWFRPSDDSEAVDNQSSGDNTVPADQWTHIVAVYGASNGEPTQMRLYINGQLANEEVSSSRYVPVRGDLLTRVGSSEFDVEQNGPSVHRFPYNGAIDELMVFDRSLSADEVAVMYQNFADYKK